MQVDCIAIMCFVWLSEETVMFALYITDRLVFITGVDCVYSAVQTESLRNTDSLVFYRFSTELNWCPVLCDGSREGTPFKQIVNNNNNNNNNNNIY